MSRAVDGPRPELDRPVAPDSEFYQVFEFAPCGYLVVDEGGVIRRANTIARRLIGEVPLVKRFLADFARPVGGRSLSQFFSEVGRGRKEIEVDIKAFSGRTQFRRLKVAATRMPAAPERLLMTLTEAEFDRTKDISAGKAELELRELIGVLPDAVAVVRQGKVALANDALGQLLETPTRDLLGVFFAELAHVEDAGPLVKALDQGDMGGAISGKVRFRLARGQRALEARFAPFSFGGSVSVLVALRDMTEIRRVTAEVEHSSRLASLGMLVAGVAHEINNPLTFVLPNLENALERLSSMPPDMMFGVGTMGDISELIVEAQTGVQRVANIVRDLKTFHKVKEEVGPVEVNQVVVDMLKLAVPKLGNRVVVERDLGYLPKMLGNSGRLGQIVLNLVLNASQSMPEGRAREKNRITIRTWSGQGGLHVEVKDNGVGIEEQDLPKLFDPFFSGRNGGTGLGLTVCSSLVREMNGWIEVDSDPGKGTRLVLRFPAIAEKQTAITARRGNEQRSLNGIRLLVVDDEPLIFRTIRRVLGRKFHLTQANSGWDAVRRLKAGLEVDAVLTDVVMPEGTGLDLFRWLKEWRPDLARYVVFMTGMVQPETMEQFPDSPHLQKPFSMDQVEEALLNLGVGDRGAVSMAAPLHSDIRELSE